MKTKKSIHEMNTTLIKASKLNGYKLESLSGECGTVRDLYFDDRFWTIRYVLADTGNWLTGRQVLLSPYSLSAVDRDAEQISIDLTRKQIEDSPALDSDKPVSRRFEEDYFGYYGWPSYWGGEYGWGHSPYITRDRSKWGELATSERAWDPHLRSTRDTDGHHIHATDGEIGHVEDFIIDDETWAIRYLIINTRNWWPGKKIVISPQWIDRVSWTDAKVFVNISRETIRKSPEYIEGSMPSRDFETSLHHHYNRQGYWVDELAWNQPVSR